MTAFPDRSLPDAAWDGDLHRVQFLLKAGANPQAGHSAALLHAAHRGHPHIVELLLAAGADPLAHRSEALHRAAKGRTARHRACVRLLVPLSDTSRWEGWEWEELDAAARALLGAGKRRAVSGGNAGALDISKMALTDPRIFEVAEKTATVLSVGLMICRGVDGFERILASDRARGYLVGFLDGASQAANLPFSSDEQFFSYVIHGHQFMAAGELKFFNGDTRKAAGFALDSLGRKGSAEFEQGQEIGGIEYFAWIDGGKSPNGLSRMFHNP